MFMNILGGASQGASMGMQMDSTYGTSESINYTDKGDSTPGWGGR
jgi:hypothetical protein